MMSIDGKERWLIHNFLYNAEPEFDTIDRDWAHALDHRRRPGLRIRDHLQGGLDRPPPGGDRFQDRRVFIAGDAAHLWIPHAGYGMNAGIADADNLGWMLAAVLNGWAEPAMLDAYQAERQPITDQVSQFRFPDVAGQLASAPRNLAPTSSATIAVGEATRAAIGKQARDLYIQQQCCGGLNFGYFYDGSPVIAYDGAEHPAYSMGSSHPQSVPGCRAPHFWLATAARFTTRWATATA